MVKPIAATSTMSLVFTYLLQASWVVPLDSQIARFTRLMFPFDPPRSTVTFMVVAVA